MNSTEEKIDEVVSSQVDEDYTWLDAGEPDLLIGADDWRECTNSPQNDSCRFVEVEIKRGWKSNEFPFPTIHIAGRKFKYLQRQPLKYIIFNKELTHFLMVDSSEICQDGWFTIKDTIHTENEPFLTVKYDSDKHLYSVDELSAVL